ncbi:MAG: OsmC family protein [Gammaproteobacteria bacterium]|nr:OsmC family protein [Gammaproteobacteria bacterium]
MTSTRGQSSGNIMTESRHSPKLYISEPLEFNGSDEQWSPEQLFVATVANCLILTFRAITNASKFSWADISCEAEGILDRVDGENKFTQMNIKVFLKVNSEADKQKALRLLTKAENQCLIKNSISSKINFINNVDCT